MELRLEVENVKCGGCARSIEKALRADPRVSGVAVDPSAGVVLIEAAAAAAKSFVSCAIGRLSG